MIKKISEEHGIETASDLINFQSIPRSTGYKLVKKKLANDLLQIPNGPGVYFFKNSTEKILYIGKAKSLKKRVNNYFANTAPTKAKKIVQASSRLGFKETNTELTALLAEAELIKIHNPKFNRQLKKYGQTYFIKLDVENSFPIPKSTSKFDLDGNDF